MSMNFRRVLSKLRYVYVQKRTNSQVRIPSKKNLRFAYRFAKRGNNIIQANAADFRVVCKQHNKTSGAR